MLGNIKEIKLGYTPMLDKEVLVISLEMPTTFTKDGKVKEITKNNMNTVCGTHIRRNRKLVEWYTMLEAEKFMFQPLLNKFLGKIVNMYGEKWYIFCRVFWYLRTNRTDCHNYTIQLMDGLQAITGINDRYIYPAIYGSKKTLNNESTYAVCSLEPMSVTELDAKEDYVKHISIFKPFEVTE